MDKFEPMYCDICERLLGWYFFDKDMQVRFKTHCQNCHVRVTREKNIKRRVP